MRLHGGFGKRFLRRLSLVLGRWERGLLRGKLEGRGDEELTVVGKFGRYHLVDVGKGIHIVRRIWFCILKQKVVHFAAIGTKYS
jgi:hypothetical protein